MERTTAKTTWGGATRTPSPSIHAYNKMSTTDVYDRKSPTVGVRRTGCPSPKQQRQTQPIALHSGGNNPLNASRKQAQAPIPTHSKSAKSSFASTIPVANRASTGLVSEANMDQEPPLLKVAHQDFLFQSVGQDKEDNELQSIFKLPHSNFSQDQGLKDLVSSQRRGGLEWRPGDGDDVRGSRDTSSSKGDFRIKTIQSTSCNGAADDNFPDFMSISSDLTDITMDCPQKTAGGVLSDEVADKVNTLEDISKLIHLQERKNKSNSKKNKKPDLLLNILQKAYNELLSELTADMPSGLRKPRSISGLGDKELDNYSDLQAAISAAVKPSRVQHTHKSPTHGDRRSKSGGDAMLRSMKNSQTGGVMRLHHDYDDPEIQSYSTESSHKSESVNLFEGRAGACVPNSKLFLSNILAHTDPLDRYSESPQEESGHTQEAMKRMHVTAVEGGNIETNSANAIGADIIDTSVKAETVFEPLSISPHLPSCVASDTGKQQRNILVPLLSLPVCKGSCDVSVDGTTDISLVSINEVPSSEDLSEREVEGESAGADLIMEAVVVSTGSAIALPLSRGSSTNTGCTSTSGVSSSIDLPASKQSLKVSGNGYYNGSIPGTLILSPRTAFDDLSVGSANSESCR